MLLKASRLASDLFTPIQSRSWTRPIFLNFLLWMRLLHNSGPLQMFDVQPCCCRKDLAALREAINKDAAGAIDH